MSIEELQAAYDDAIKRVRGSVCHDLAEPIEAYVVYISGLCTAMMENADEDYLEYRTPLMIKAGEIKKKLDSKSDQA